MLRRNTVWFVGLLLCLAASHSSGLGLGVVTVESYLNQPLRLRIEIIELGENRIDDVTVQMASADDFARFGIERVGILSSVRFRAQEYANGAYVLLTSNEIVTEPYLSFILETRFPSGRSLSEHTALFDLPVYLEESARAGSGLSQPTSAVLQEPDNNTARSALSERNTIETDSSSTLIGIARQIRPDESFSLQQTMIAIQMLNPNAFADGNINRLLSGQVLRIPIDEEIRSIDAAEAFAEVGRQNQQIADLEPFAVPGQNDSRRSGPSGRLSVIAADLDADAGIASSATALAAAQGNEELDRRIDELETILLVRQEEADRARVDRENLSFRLADLEAQIEAAQELIRLQDIRLAQLRESLALAQAAAEAAAAEQAAIRDSDTQTSAAETASTGLLAALAKNPIILVAGLGFGVLLLVWVMLRRNRLAVSKDSRLEPLFETQVDQRTATEEAVLAAAFNESKSIGGVSELGTNKVARSNEEQNEIVSASGGFPGPDHAEGLDAAPVDADRAADDTDSFLGDLGIDPDEFDSSAFDLDYAEDSTFEGQGFTQKGSLPSEDLEMTFELSDPESPELVEEEGQIIHEQDTVDFENEHEVPGEGLHGRQEGLSEKTVVSPNEVEEQDLHLAVSLPEEQDLEQIKFTDSEARNLSSKKTLQADADNSGQEGYLDGEGSDISAVESVSKVELADLDFLSEEEISSPADADNETDESIDELFILSDEEETATKLELAYAYQKMGDFDGANEILQEVIAEGNEDQIEEARELLEALRENP